MLIYDFFKRSDHSLYEYLYICLKNDIVAGRLPAGSRLPSKRELAYDNQISVRTVMNAYEQLLTEGYITSEEKRGYYVADVEFDSDRLNLLENRTFETEPEPLVKEEKWFADFTSNAIVYEKFPYSLWSKTMREVLSEYSIELVRKAPFLGIYELRLAISEYLYRARGMQVLPERILIGASIEYLYMKLMNLLPKNSVYGTENPGYRKIPGIYKEYGAEWKSIDVDEEGLDMQSLYESGVNIVHVSPEHHYPLGTTMTAAKRLELLRWAAEKTDRYIIEDDYDCEFRYHTRSISALQSMDTNHRVIYMNTFSKSLSPAIRISYMVLPEKLMSSCINNANFYSNSVSSCEQYTLARFIKSGAFERHLSRMKKYYQREGELLLKVIKQTPLIPAVRIAGTGCGTHLLIYLDTSLTDVEIKWAAKSQGINLSCLSEFCTVPKSEYSHALILNYSNMNEEAIRETIRRLSNIFIEW